MRRWLTVVPVLVLVATLVGVSPLAPTGAEPVCPDPSAREECGGRVFPEPIDSQTALTYAETAEGLRALAEEFPEWLTVSVIGTSFDGDELLMAEVTDPDGDVALADRKVVLVSQSIHGNEPGGREGGVRYLEDLLRVDADRHDAERRALLDRVRFVQVFLNPDGWQAGDHDAVPDGDSIGLWARGNGNGPLGVSDVGGVDLNRNAPWFGFIPEGRTPVSEPEMEAIVAEVQRRLGEGQDLQVTNDIHGEVPDAAAVIMLSAGRFDLAGSMQQRLQGDDMVAQVTAALADNALVAQEEQQRGTEIVPAILHASSEFGPVGVGGSGSGFLGDWLSQADGGNARSLSTIELLSLPPEPQNPVSPGFNSLTADLELLQIYRDTVAAILGSMLEQALVDHRPAVTLPGPTGYVHDPATVADPVRDGVEVTQMDFFTDLDAYLDQPLVRLGPDEVDAETLSELDALVVATDVLDDVAVADVGAFAEQGGNVVLTDTALRELPGLVDGLAADDVVEDLSDINQIDLSAGREDPLTEGVRDIAFLLVEPSTLGYDSSAGSATPAWRVTTEAWEGAGGTTLGTIAEETGLGRISVGEGQVTIIGQLLPPPVGDTRILYGIESYGVLDTGYLVLLGALQADLEVTAVDALGQDGPVTVTRVAGVDRIDTAIEASRASYADAAAGGVVLARADAFPDAMAGTTLAAAGDAPLLLSNPDALDERVATEIRRVLPEGGTVTLLGGGAALGSAVAQAVTDLGYAVERLAGPDRFATAVAIAEALAGGQAPATVFAATGADYPAALAAGAAAAHVDGVVVLTDDERVPEVTEAYLTDTEAEIVAVGPEAVAALPEARAVTRTTTFETVAAVAEAFFDAPTTVGIATSAAFADALSGGPHIALRDGPILLVEPDEVPAATAAYLQAGADSIGEVVIYGGVAAVDEQTEQAIVALLD